MGKKVRKKGKSWRKRILVWGGILLLLTAVYKIWIQHKIALLTGTKVVEAETEQMDEESEDVEETTYTIEKKIDGEGEKQIVYYVIDIHLAKASDLKTAFAHDTFGQYVEDTMSNIAKEHNVAMAVNGDYCGFRSNGIVIRNGVIYRDEPSRRDCYVLYRDGTARVVKETETSAQELLDAGAWNVFSFGPALLEDGEVCDGLDEDYKVDDYNVSISGLEPRTVIGYIEPNHYIILAVDGRRANYSRGMNFEMLSEVLVDLGCESAYNLDGGSSVTVYENGEIINRPCWWFADERGISDIVYIEKKDDAEAQDGQF